MTDLNNLARTIGDNLKQQGWLLTCAESCTGGWVAQVITSVPGSSQWFDRGFVTYTNLAKQQMLDVSEEILSEQGAVSESTVLAMAKGAIAHSEAQISLAISGIAGPGGGSVDKPVGTVWIAWSSPRGTHAQCYQFTGDRQTIRKQAVVTALQEILDILTEAE